MKRSLAFFVLVLALGIYAPLGAQADEGEIAFVSFTLNGAEDSAEISSDTPEVEISVSASEEARFTRLYICPEASDPCDGSSAIKFFSPNATTTSFTRSWEGLAVSDEPVEPGVYHLTVRFFRYGLSPEAFEETAPYSITVVGEDEQEEEDLEDEDNFDDIPGGDIVCCFVDSDLSVTIGGREYQGPEGFFDGFTTFQPPLIIDGGALENPSQTITILFREREDEEQPGHIRIVFDHPVPAERGAYVLHRLVDDPTPDNGPEGDTLFPGVNFSLVHGAIPANDGNLDTVESVAITFPDLPALGSPSAPSGTYHISVFEYPETKSIYDPEAGTFTEEPYTDADFFRSYEWGFVSDEYAGDYPELYSPDNEASLTIDEYIATTDPVYQECCSSVVFLPGIQGSRLSDETGKRWEPSGDQDVQALYLDSSGKSVNASTTATEVIDTFDGPGGLDIDIYTAFLNDLAVASSTGTIASYAAIPYDWRLSLPDILADGSIEEQLRNLAATSHTGKIVIVAHSNGGILAKALLNELGDEADDLVDQVIMVGVPQLGTPQAIGALLHGFDTGIPFTFSSKRARDFAKNAPMTYQLIPHTDYYHNANTTISTPLVVFEPGLGTQSFIDAYGSVIGNGTELHDFLIGTEGRSEPSYDDLQNPALGNDVLLSEAETVLQAVGSSWQAPEGITVHQIAGIGEDTLAGITYKPSIRCAERFVSQTSTPTCLRYEPSVIYTPEEVIDGDGTVVVPSALAMSDVVENVKRWWINTNLYNETEHPFSNFSGLGFFRTNHKNLLEIDELRSFIFDNLITKSSDTLPQYLSDIAPSINSDDRLRFILHSPLSLSAIDSEGNEISETTATIPGATYKQYGEVQIITIPKGAHPTVILTGVEEGSFTFEIEEYLDDALVATSTFAGVPSDEHSVVSISFVDGTLQNAGTLLLDYDGDGTTDVTLHPEIGKVISLPEGEGEDENTESAPVDVPAPSGGGGPLWNSSGTLTSPTPASADVTEPTQPIIQESVEIPNESLDSSLLVVISPSPQRVTPPVETATSTNVSSASTTAQLASVVEAAPWYDKAIGAVQAFFSTALRWVQSL